MVRETDEKNIEFIKNSTDDSLDYDQLLNFLFEKCLEKQNEKSSTTYVSDTSFSNCLNILNDDKNLLVNCSNVLEYFRCICQLIKTEINSVEYLKEIIFEDLELPVNHRNEFHIKDLNLDKKCFTNIVKKWINELKILNKLCENFEMTKDDVNLWSPSSSSLYSEDMFSEHNDSKKSLAYQEETKDLKSRIDQLDKLVSILRAQLQNSEEINAQLSNDIDFQKYRSNQINVNYDKIKAKLEQLEIENDQMKKLNDQLTSRENNLINDNTILIKKLDEKDKLIKSNEKILAILNSKMAKKDQEIQVIKKNLNNEKILRKDIQQKYNKFEQQLNQLKSKIQYEEKLTNELKNKLKDIESESENKLKSKKTCTLKSSYQSKQKKTRLYSIDESDKEESNEEISINCKSFLMEQMENSFKKNDLSILNDLIEYFQEYVSILTEIKRKALVSSSCEQNNKNDKNIAPSILKETNQNYLNESNQDYDVETESIYSTYLRDEESIETSFKCDSYLKEKLANFYRKNQILNTKYTNNYFSTCLKNLTNLNFLDQHLNNEYQFLKNFTNWSKIKSSCSNVYKNSAQCVTNEKSNLPQMISPTEQTLNDTLCTNIIYGQEINSKIGSRIQEINSNIEPIQEQELNDKNQIQANCISNTTMEQSISSSSGLKNRLKENKPEKYYLDSNDNERIDNIKVIQNEIKHQIRIQPNSALLGTQRTLDKNTSLSLPSLFDLPENKEKITCEEKGIQTDDDSSYLIIQSKKIAPLQSQLTRDSGIESLEAVSIIETNKSKEKLNLIKVISNTRENSLDHESDGYTEEKNDLNKSDSMINRPNTLSSISFDNGASNRRKIFKNSFSKHHTVEVSILNNSSILQNEKNNLIDSFEPIIKFTKLSKLASELKVNNEVKSTAKIDIDDILDIHELPQFPISNSNKFSSPEAIRSRDKFIKRYSSRQNSLCLTGQSSFEDNSSVANENQAISEHRIKLLESNFNQIVMSQNTDENLLKICLENYIEKFQKSDRHTNVLFDETFSILNRIVTFMNSSPFTDSNNTENNLTSCKLNRKFLQENLNSLNKTLHLVRKEIIDLLTLSSTIGGLRQEQHLVDLIKISISYSKELRKVIDCKNFDYCLINQRRNKVNEKIQKSISTHSSEEAHEEENQTKFTTENNQKIENKNQDVNLSKKSDDKPKKNWLNSISIIRSIANMSRLKTNNLKRRDLMRPKIEIITVTGEKCEETSFDGNSSIDNLPIKKDNCLQSKVINAAKQFENFLIKAKAYTDCLDLNQMSSLIAKDSFKCVRLGVSMFLFLFSMIFLLITFIKEEDLYENTFKSIFNYAELKKNIYK